MSGSVNSTDFSIPLRPEQLAAQGGGATAAGGLGGQNPLDMASKVLGIQQAKNQLALFPGQQQLQQQQIQAGQLGIGKATTELANTNLSAAASAALPIMNDPNTLTSQNLTTTLASAEHHLGIQTQPLLQAIADLPEAPDTPEWKARVKSLVVTYAQAGNPTQQISNITPTGALQDTGSTLVPVRTPAATSLTPGIPTAVPGQPGIAKTPTWSEANQPVHYTDDQGRTVNTTAFRYAQSHGGVQLSAGNLPAGVYLGAATGPNVISDTGNGASGAPQSSPQGAQPAGGTPGTPQNAGASSGLPVGASVAPSASTLESMLASAQDMNGARQKAGTFTSDMYPLTAAANALKNAPIGKSAPALHAVSSVVNSLTPSQVGDVLHTLTGGLFMDPASQAAYEEARKYLTQAQLAAPGAQRSNEGLQTAGEASPNVTLSPQAAQVVLRGIIGLRRMEQDKYLQFQDSGKPSSDWGTFAANWSKTADPRVYQFDQMDPAERSAIKRQLGGDNDPRWQQFKNQVMGAKSRDIYSPYGQ